MTTTIEAVFDGKVLQLDEPLALAPNTRVRITVEAIEPHPSASTSFLRTARSLRLDAPADFATHVDAYLYGETPDATT